MVALQAETAGRRTNAPGHGAEDKASGAPSSLRPTPQGVAVRPPVLRRRQTRR